MRTILTGSDEAAQIFAALMLADILQNGDVESEIEAEQLYNRVVRESESITRTWNKNLRDGRGGNLLMPGGKKMWIPRAEAALKQIQASGLGKPAPELSGVDLDGESLALADHKGHVVMVSFWASWCGPCMQMVPHEREVVKRFADRPFVLLGVNGDTKPEAATKAVDKYKISWRSFQNERESADSLSQAWGVRAWPTIYLIDHKGIIRKRWVGAPANAVLDTAIEKLVAEAEAAGK